MSAATAKRPRIAFSPITRRRFANFRANRRSWWSFWIFLALFGLSLGAEVIANDRPLLAVYKGELLFPAFVNYLDDKFGGFGVAPDYRDPNISDEIEAHGWMVWPPIRFANNTVERDAVAGLPAAPTWALDPAKCRAKLAEIAARGGHAAPPGGGSCRDFTPMWLGSDVNGQDIVARLIYGFRQSVLFGLTLAGISSIIGVAVGAVQGYFGGWFDLVAQRVIEIWSSMPHLYILIIFANIFVPSFFVLLGILLMFSWVHLVHVVRAEFLRARNFEYVTAARALGLSDARIIVKHVLPNATTATLTFLPFVVNGAIGTLTSLDYLGLGMPIGSPSIGELLSEGKSNLSAPWIVFSAFFVTVTLLALLVFIGEGVRDAFDHRKTAA